MCSQTCHCNLRIRKGQLLQLPEHCMWNTTASVANVSQHPWKLVIGFWNLYKHFRQQKRAKNSMNIKWPLPSLCIPNISWLLLINSKLLAVRKSEKWSFKPPVTGVLDNILKGGENNCWVLIWTIMLQHSKQLVARHC